MSTTPIIFVLKANKVLYLLPNTADARVAELVDALDSKSSSFGSAGSIPASGTKWETFSRESPFFVFKLCKTLILLKIEGLKKKSYNI